MDKELGKVIHFYDKIGVAVIKITGGSLSVGDNIKFVKNEEEYVETVESMQIEHENVKSAKKGSEVAVKTSGKAKEGTLVFKEK